MNWVKRHLNWSLIAGIAVIGLFALLLMPLHLLVGQDTGEAIFFGYILLSPFLALLLTGWHLRQKGQSLVNLLWLLLVGWGIIIILCLKNKTGERMGGKNRRVIEETAPQKELRDGSMTSTQNHFNQRKGRND